MTPLTGKVYSLGGRVGGAREPHPHVVVIELSEQCLLVPAFSLGGDEIERYKQSVFTNLGLRPDQAFAEIDNATCVRFFDARAAHPATWVVEGARPSPKEEIHGRTPIGEMNDAGLLKIVTVLVALTEARPDAYSPHLKKRIRKVAEDLAAQVNKMPGNAGDSPADGT